MHSVALIWGILAAVGMVVGFVPCLGALNWLNIPYAGFGIIACGIAFSRATDDQKKSAITGLVLCTIALFFGLIRLVLGGGVL
jgi:hypothetical protein